VAVADILMNDGSKEITGPVVLVTAGGDKFRIYPEDQDDTGYLHIQRWTGSAWSTMIRFRDDGDENKVLVPLLLDGVAIEASGFKVAETQVVGQQQAHIADADAGSIVTQFNTLLAALETHGLLASS
jgi:hypothetical protein